MECFRLLLDHLAWIEHQLLGGIRDSLKAGSLRGIMRCVGGVRKSIHQIWLTKGLGLGLLCWGFKTVQEEIPREEASTLQIGFTQEDFHGFLPEVVGTVQQMHCRRRRSLRRGLVFHVCTINKSVHTKKVWKLIKYPHINHCRLFNAKFLHTYEIYMICKHDLIKLNSSNYCSISLTIQLSIGHLFSHSKLSKGSISNDSV